MLIGAQIHSNATSWDRALRVAQLMDRGPWHSVWVPDHFVPPLAFLDETGDCFEAWSMLTAFAATTERLRLGDFGPDWSKCGRPKGRGSSITTVSLRAGGSHSEERLNQALTPECWTTAPLSRG